MSAVLRRTAAKCLVAAAVTVGASTASAFGLKTHLWIGVQLLQELQQSCRVKIPGAQALVPLDQDVCESIRRNPGAFLSGVLGPDVYPDMLTGQVTTHPGVPGMWQTNRWLMHMYAQAKPGAELAFAAGYLVHAASDMFAHTYVNGYVGDVFDLAEGRDAPVRHITLERYIDSKLPEYRLNPQALTPPAGYLRDKLLHDREATANGANVKRAMHVAAMALVYNEVRDAVGKAQQIQLEGDVQLLQTSFAVQGFEKALRLASGDDVHGASASLAAARVQRAQSKTLVADTRAGRAALAGWLKDMEQAGAAYIDASNTVARGVVTNGTVDPRTTYSDWWSRYGRAYVGVPDAYSRFVHNLPERLKERLPEGLKSLYEQWEALRERIDAALKQVVKDHGPDLVGRLTGQVADERFAELLLQGRPITSEELDAEFAANGHEHNTLLKFAKVSAMVDEDLGLQQDGRLDPTAFHALKNAVVLSKLALMRHDNLRTLVMDANFGANADLLPAPRLVKVGDRYSILYDMARSIDGNHQWQPYGVPYARENGLLGREAAEERRFGFGPGLPVPQPHDPASNNADDRPGFPLFVDAALRDAVFLKIFSGPVAGRLADALPPNHPFPECAKNAFPVTFKASGEIAPSDRRCEFMEQPVGAAAAR